MPSWIVSARRPGATPLSTRLVTANSALIKFNGPLTWVPNLLCISMLACSFMSLILSLTVIFFKQFKPPSPLLLLSRYVCIYSRTCLKCESFKVWFRICFYVLTGLSEHVLQGQVQTYTKLVQPCAGHVVASPRECWTWQSSSGSLLCCCECSICI